MLMLRRLMPSFAIALLVAAAMIAAPLIPSVSAAPPLMPALGSSVFPVVAHISGANTATVTNVVKWVAPFPVRFLYATSVAQAKVGTHLSNHGRSSLIIKNNASNITVGVGTPAGVGLAVALPAAGSATETNASSASGTAIDSTQQNVASGDPVVADLVLWGSSPSITNITLVMWFQRR